MRKQKSRKQRRKFTPEYKAEVVDLIRQGDRSLGEVCRDLGLTDSAVRRWYQQAEKIKGNVSSPNLSEAERSELGELRKEVKRLRMEREILKKATAFFAREST